MEEKPAPANEMHVDTDTQFWPVQPMLWLKENQEKLADILIAALEEKELSEISDIMLDPPEMKYDAVKARLVSIRERRLGRGSGWLMKLLTEMELADQQPSCLLQRMRNIVKYAAADVPDTTLRCMWMNKLTIDMQTAIIIMECTLRINCTLHDLAELADKLMESGIINKQLSYFEKHNTPSQLLNNLQMLKYDTPDAFAMRNIIKELPSFMKIAIAVRTTINTKFTVQDLVAFVRKTLSFKADQEKKLASLLNYGRIKNEILEDYMNRIMSTSASNVTPLHVWMRYLPLNIREAIVIRQALDSNWTHQELAQLADKIAELKQPKK